MTDHKHQWTVDHKLTDENQVMGEVFAYCECGAHLDEHRITEVLNNTLELLPLPLEEADYVDDWDIPAAIRRGRGRGPKS